MEKKFILIGLIVLILAAFFWPKINSREDDFFTAGQFGGTYFKNMACTCIGFTVQQNNCLSCTQYTDCYGIPTSCGYGCYTKIDGKWQAAYCDNGSAIDLS